MSFERLPTRSARMRVPVSMSLNMFADGKYARVTINISLDLLRSLGWTVPAKVAVYIGTGEDAGKLRIARKDDHQSLTLGRISKCSMQCRVQINAWDELPKRTCRTQPVEYQIIGERPAQRMLEIILPDWTAEPPSPPAPITQPARPAGGHTGGRRVPVDAGRLRALVARKTVDEDKSSAEIVATLAEASGLSQASVRRILAGSVPTPPLKRLEGFARVLGVSLEDLLAAAATEKSAAGPPEDILRRRLKGRRFEDDVRAVAECARAGLGSVMA